MQVMEQRYSALMEAHGKLSGQKDQLQRENESLKEVSIPSHPVQHSTVEKNITLPCASAAYCRLPIK
jgi:hypothetical protein